MSNEDKIWTGGHADDAGDDEREPNKKEAVALHLLAQLHTAVDQAINLVMGGFYSPEVMELVWLKAAYLESQMEPLMVIAQRSELDGLMG